MREIKFRAWDKNNKLMLYRGFFDRNWYSTPKNDESGCNCVREFVPEDTHKLEVMQFTGLKDKNGKEIYEGDILEPNMEVVWVINGFYLKFDAQLDIMNWGMRDYDSSRGIIGNIYEYPVALK